MAMAKATRPGFFARRKMIREAGALVRETRRILRRRGWRVEPAVEREIAARADALRGAMRARDFEAVPREAERLEGLVDQHLAFARKSTLREYAESVGTA